MKKFLFLISMTNPIRYATLLSLMMFLSNYAYGSHAAGLDLTYQCISGGSISGVQITVIINTDFWGNEITWTITDANGVVVASGGPYGFGVNTYTVTACVPTGTLNFNWYDSFGDGWNWGGIQGSYSVMQGSATLTSGSPNFGSSGSSTFYISGGTPCTISLPYQYLVTLKFYRACGPAATTASAPNGNWLDPNFWTYLNVYSDSCELSVNLTLLEAANSGQEITPICPNYNTLCNGGSIPGMEEYIYEGILTLPSQCVDWKIIAAIWARNPSITTVNTANNYDLCVEAFINNTTSVGCNNSPEFSQKPVPFICTNQTYCYNNGATDAEGDSLVYNLIYPLYCGVLVGVPPFGYYNFSNSSSNIPYSFPYN